MINEFKKDICFIVLPGFAPDSIPVEGIKKQLEDHGYAAITANFWGDSEITNFSALTIEQCKAGISQLVKNTHKKYKYVIGVGISLGGALLLEHAKRNNGLHCIVSVGTPFKLRNKFLIKLGFVIYPLLNIVWKRLQKIKELRLTPIEAAKMVIDYLEGDFLRNLDSIQTQTLFIHSKKDLVTDYRALENFSWKISSAKKQIVYLDVNDHAIKYDCAEILNALTSFLSLPVRKELIPSPEFINEDEKVYYQI